jgi:hypothetical protein
MVNLDGFLTDKNSDIKYWELIVFVVEKLGPTYSNALAKPTIQNIQVSKENVNSMIYYMNDMHETLNFLSDFSTLPDPCPPDDVEVGRLLVDLKQRLQRMIDNENVEPPRYPVFDDGNVVWKDESGSACQELKEGLLQLKAFFANRPMEDIQDQSRWPEAEGDFSRDLLTSGVGKLAVLERYKRYMDRLDELLGKSMDKCWLFYILISRLK